MAAAKRYAGHVDARVAHIADLMRTLKFQRGKTVKALAKEWGLGEQRVRELSAMASKIVRAEVTDPDAVTVTVCTYLERVLEQAWEKGDRKHVVLAAKVWAEMAGAGKLGRRFAGKDDEDTRSPEETLAELDVVRAKLAGEIEARKAGIN